MKASKLFSILVLSILLSSCLPNNHSDLTDNKTASDPVVLDSIKSIIREKTDLFTAAHISRDTAYLNNIFTDDARVFPPNSEVVEGKTAISNLNNDWVSYGIHKFTEESTALYGSEKYIIDEGVYQMKFGADSTLDHGKYINIWKYDRGEWKIYSNIWNTSLNP